MRTVLWVILAVIAVIVLIGILSSCSPGPKSPCPAGQSLHYWPSTGAYECRGADR